MTISVALCTYNGEKHIEEQIYSILNQSLKVNEIIICDDQSTDATVSILKKLQVDHSSIVIFENECNLRSTKNFEKAISLCSGEYIFLSDQDDIWKKDKVAKILTVFNENPIAEGVFSNADLINDKGNSIPKRTIWDSVFFLENELPKPLDFFDIITKNGNVATGATLCIKSSVKSFIFPFTEDVLHDEKIAVILALRNSLLYSTENLISYRIHDNQQVGMKNVNKLDKKKKLKRIILGLDEPKSFKEFSNLSKKKYLKLKKAKNLQNQLFIKTNIQDLIKKSLDELNEINKEIKSKFPFQYYISILLDKFLDKRKSL